MTSSPPTYDNNELEEPDTTIETPEQGEDEIEARRELAALQDSLRHATDQWTRCQADLQNYRKRVDKERSEWVQSGLAPMVRSLLPILDDLDRAFLTLPPLFAQLTWTEGIALVGRKLLVTLEQYGLKEIGALGQLFDPAKHQAVLEGQTKDVPDGHVMAVLQKGYMFGDKVLRPSLVQVARSPQPAAAGDDHGPEHAADETAK